MSETSAERVQILRHPTDFGQQAYLKPPGSGWPKRSAWPWHVYALEAAARGRPEMLAVLHLAWQEYGGYRKRWGRRR